MLCRRMLRLALLASVATCGSEDLDVPIDSTPTPDSGPCLGANATCNGDVLAVCSAAGAQVIEETCGWGCEVLGSSPRCKRLVPTGGAASTVDTLPTTLGSLPEFSLSGTLDGTQGKINGVAASTLGVDFKLENGIAVFRFNSLAIGGVRLAGTSPIVLISDGELGVNGTIDATGQCGNGSPEIAGAGGGNGGTISGADGSGTGAGNGGLAPAVGAGGGGGAGHGGVGGLSGGGELGGILAGDAIVSVLRGGAGGGAGAGTVRFQGGGGGGAIQLISNTRIHLTLGGNINAGGCGGRGGGAAEDEGGGGGAGGTIVLEAPDVTLEAGRVLAVNGGGGGGGGLGATDGGAGRLSRDPAIGGNAGTVGGAGGHGAAAAIFNGGDGGVGKIPGGGGGAAGRIRINTRSGAATIFATLSPGLGDPNSTATVGTAALQ